MLLAPALTRPAIGIALAGAVVAVWLAWKSVVYPLALAGIPSLVSGIVGSNPLPKGGATILLGAWIGLAVLLAMMRGEHSIRLRAVWSAPAAMAFLVLVLMVLRLGPSAAESYGFTKTELYVADNLLFLIGAVFVGSNRQSLKLFLILKLAVVAAGAVFLLVQLASGGAQQQYSGRFVISAQQGAIGLGREAANGALISIGLILIATTSWVRTAAIAVLPAVLVALIAAGSRGPVIAFFVGLLVLTALAAANGRARRQLLLATGVLIGAAIIVPIVVPGSAIGRALSAIVGGSEGLSSNGRSQLWAQAYAAFGAHPLFGIGTGGFASLDPALYPHNLLLELAVEVGVLGPLAVGSMIAMMFRRLIVLWQWTSGSARLEVTLVIALLLSGLVNAMFSGAIQDNADIWLWGGLGLGMYARQATRDGVRRRSTLKSRTAEASA